MDKDVRVYISIGCRPSYDSATECRIPEMTVDELRTLRNLIHRYAQKVIDRGGAMAAMANDPNARRTK